MWPCGVITILDELFKSESKSQVYGCLHGFFHNNPSTANIGKYRNSFLVIIIQYTDILCYDDGCHLRKYAQNPVRASLSNTAIQLSKLEIVVDKMHFTGHTDKWCRATCNPYNVEALENVCLYNMKFLHVLLQYY